MGHWAGRGRLLLLGSLVLKWLEDPVIQLWKGSEWVWKVLNLKQFQNFQVYKNPCSNIVQICSNLIKVVQIWSKLFKLAFESSSSWATSKFSIHFKYLCDNCGQLWPILIIVTNFDNCDNYHQLWQLSPIVTILTICDDFNKLLRFWPIVTILTICDNFDKMLKLWPLVTILTNCDNFDQLWVF